MKIILLACALVLASCSEPASRISVEVKTPIDSDGPVKIYRSKRIEVEVPPEAAAAIAAEMRKDVAKR